jgi:hypothetical protein
VLEGKGDGDNGEEPSNTESICLCDPFASFRVVSQRDDARMTTRLLRAWQPRSSPVGTNHEHATCQEIVQR